MGRAGEGCGQTVIIFWNESMIDRLWELLMKGGSKCCLRIGDVRYPGMGEEDEGADIVGMSGQAMGRWLSGCPRGWMIWG